jgi:hypothetical protein
METNLEIEVAVLDAHQRRALEEVIGRQLAVDQRLTISVMDAATPQAGASRPAQSLEDWTSVYEGLSEDEIEAVDNVVKTRANLTRNLP